MGLKPSALLGRTLSDAAPAVAGGGRLEMLGKVLLEGRSCVEDGVALNRPGGGSVILNLRFVPYRSGGRITGAVLLAVDVIEEQILRSDLK